jgi:hypothetical protein
MGLIWPLFYQPIHFANGLLFAMALKSVESQVEATAGYMASF